MNPREIWNRIASLFENASFHPSQEQEHNQASDSSSRPQGQPEDVSTSTDREEPPPPSGKGDLSPLLQAAREISQQLKALGERLENLGRTDPELLQRLDRLEETLPDQIRHAVTEAQEDLPDRVARAAAQVPMTRAKDSLDENVQQIRELLGRHEQQLSTLARDVEETSQGLAGLGRKVQGLQSTNETLLEETRGQIQQEVSRMQESLEAMRRYSRRRTWFLVALTGIFLLLALLMILP